jgi:hypothetical protein
LAPALRVKLTFTTGVSLTTEIGAVFFPNKTEPDVGAFCIQTTQLFEFGADYCTSHVALDPRVAWLLANYPPLLTDLPMDDCQDDACRIRRLARVQNTARQLAIWQITDGWTNVEPAPSNPAEAIEAAILFPTVVIETLSILADIPSNPPHVKSLVLSTQGEGPAQQVAAALPANLTLGDRVWYDRDNDGVQDDETGEPGVPDLPVELYGNSVCAGTPMSTTVTADGTGTDPAGFYEFNGLAEGSYCVKFLVPDGFVVSPPSNAGDDTKDSDANATGLIQNIELTQDDPDEDMGLSLAALGDYVWEDKNVNGIQDDGSDSGINGVTVRLLDCQGNPVLAGNTPLTQVTADDGNGNPGFYLFQDLMPGCYQVEFEKPASFNFTTPNQGDEGSDSDASLATGRTGNVNLVAGERNLLQDAGLFQGVRIVFDKQWLDFQTQEPSEPPTLPAGFQITAESSLGTATCTYTAGALNCVYANRPPLLASGLWVPVGGSYTVGEANGPAGWTLAPDDDGDYQFEAPDDLDDQPPDIPPHLQCAEGAANGCVHTLVNNELPPPPLSALGNFVWHDVNGNGLQDDGEPGVPDVTVNLLDNTNTVIETVQTDGNGLYLFDNLNASVYQVEFVLPDGFDSFTTPGQPNPATNSDADLVSGRTGPINLPAGVTDDTWDAGLLCLFGVIEGKLNAGVLSGDIPIFLLPQNNPNVDPLFLATQPDGSFRFTNVLPGTYLVQVHDKFLSDRGLVPTLGSGSGAVVTMEACQSATVNYFYTEGIGALGDFVWYDVNTNGLQDEWVDANNDGLVTQNFLTQDMPTIPFDQFEWYDINDDGSYTGPENEGELYKCGLEVATPDLLTLFSGGDPNTVVGGERTGVIGYYRFNGLALGEPGWTVQFDGQDPALIAAAEAMFATGLCKPLPTTAAAIASTGEAGVGIAGETETADITVCGLTTGVSDAVVLTVEQPVYLDADFGIRCVTQAELTALGDKVWVDANQNGLQDEENSGLANVTVNLYRVTEQASAASPLVAGDLISTTVTDAAGIYGFAALPLGSYFVEFIPPAGYIVTQPDVQGNSQDALDSDAVVPVVAVAVSDGGVRAALGKPLTYTVSYTNTDPEDPATGVVLSVTVPVSTTADLSASTSGWSCDATPASGGTTCQLVVGTLAAGAVGSVQFVVVLENDEKAPTTIQLTVSLTHTTPGRTHVTTPPASGADLTLDAGVYSGVLRQTTRAATVREPRTPTDLDETNQPGRSGRAYLPVVP